MYVILHKKTRIKGQTDLACTLYSFPFGPKISANKIKIEYGTCKFSTPAHVFHNKAHDFCVTSQNFIVVLYLFLQAPATIPMPSSSVRSL